MAEQRKIERTPVYTLCRIIFGALFHTIMPVRYFNAEALNGAESPYIIISNHKSAIDPFVLAFPT